MSETLTYEQLMAAFKETREQMEASSAETDRKLDKTDRMIKRVSKQLGYMSYRNGAAAENYFYNSFKKSKEFGDEKFDYARKISEVQSKVCKMSTTLFYTTAAVLALSR